MPKKILIEFNGKIACIAEHSRDLGVNPKTVINRHIKTGESYEKCLEYYQENKVREQVYQILFNNKIASLIEHCNDLNINIGTVRGRHQKTGESYPECLKYYQENGVKFKSKYKIKDRRLYKKWCSTKDKCKNPSNPSYKWYGERGIKVCERWQIYENFESDLLESFLEHVEKYGIKDTQIERVDYNGNYEPSNVTWATRKEQANNRSTNKIVIGGLNVAQFAEKYNIPYRIVLVRLNAGWSVEEIIATPIQHRYKYYLPCGKLLKYHCNDNGYTYNAIREYIKKYNLEPQEALARYLKNKQKRNKKY